MFDLLRLIIPVIPTVYVSLLAVAEKQYRASIIGWNETPTSIVSLVEFALFDCKRLLQLSPGPYRMLQNLLSLSCWFRNVQTKLIRLGSNLMLTKWMTSPRPDDCMRVVELNSHQHARLTCNYFSQL